MLELIISPTSMNLIKRCDFCDAFIVGEADKGLRLAEYFNFEEIQEIISLCKSRNQKLYIACNKIIHEAEIEDFRKSLKILKDLEIDGIIFGDFAVYQIAKNLNLTAKLIYNPETYITNYQSARFFAEKGIKRIALAKEITLEDINTIAGKQYIETEILGHGAVNMFHSFRDLVTNYQRYLHVENPDKFHNRQMYIIEEKRQEKYPLIEDQNGTHVFSGEDMCTIDYLDVLIANHVTAIRIDGILKSDKETYEIAKVYREAINDYQIDKTVYLNKKNTYLDKLGKIENIRAFNSGFLFKKTIYKG